MTDTITVHDQEFTLSGFETLGGEVLRETYFASDGSYLIVQIDYTHTNKGHK